MTGQKLTDLGWANYWKETPPAVSECVQLRHNRGDVDDDPTNRGLKHRVWCDICKYVFRYDSSD
jgi:hypothetical protein